MKRITFYELDTPFGKGMIYARVDGDLYLWTIQDNWSLRHGYRQLKEITKADITRMIITGEIEDDFKLLKEWEHEV